MKPIIIKYRDKATRTRYVFFTDTFTVEHVPEYRYVSVAFLNSNVGGEVHVQAEYLPSDFTDFEVISGERYYYELQRVINETVQEYVEEYLLSDDIILDAHQLIEVVAEKAYKFYQTFISNLTGSSCAV